MSAAAARLACESMTPCGGPVGAGRVDDDRDIMTTAEGRDRVPPLGGGRAAEPSGRRGLRALRCSSSSDPRASGSRACPSRRSSPDAGAASRTSSVLSSCSSSSDDHDLGDRVGEDVTDLRFRARRVDTDARPRRCLGYRGRRTSHSGRLSASDRRPCRRSRRRARAARRPTLVARRRRSRPSVISRQRPSSFTRSATAFGCGAQRVAAASPAALRRRLLVGTCRASSCRGHAGLPQVCLDHARVLLHLGGPPERDGLGRSRAPARGRRCPSPCACRARRGSSTTPSSARISRM